MKIDKDKWIVLREAVLGQPNSRPVHAGATIDNSFASIEFQGDDEAHAYITATHYKNGTAITIGRTHFLVGVDDVVVVRDGSFPKAEWEVMYDSRVSPAFGNQEKTPVGLHDCLAGRKKAPSEG